MERALRSGLVSGAWSRGMLLLSGLQLALIGIGAAAELHRRDLPAFLSAAMTSGVLVISASKSLALATTTPGLVDILRRLREAENLAGAWDFGKAARERERRRKRARLSLGFNLGIVVGSLHWAAKPLLTGGLPVPAWTPWSLDSAAGFTAAYLLQVVFGLYVIGSLALYDSLFGSMAERLLGQFSLLEEELATASYGNGGKGPSLRHCARHQRLIIGICAELRDTFLPNLLFQGVTTVIPCFCGVFHIAVFYDEMDHNTLINLLELISLGALSWGFYCVYCNELTYQSGQMGTNVYMGPWEDAIHKDTFYFISIMSSKPIVFGSKVMVVNLANIGQFFKAVISYYNFIMAVYSPQDALEK